MALNDFFVWGPGGGKLTPEQIAQLKAIEAKKSGGIDVSPVQHWTQGAARVADAIAGAFQRGTIDRAETENSTYNEGIIKSLLGGSEPAQTSAIPASGASAEIAATGPQSYRDAIAGIESAGSGDYAAIGPTNKTLGRPLGRYQVMEANLGPWSQEALGRAVTPDEFLASPEIQDAIFDKKFGSYVEQFGPEGAAQAWFAGPGGVGKVDRQDVLGTSVGEYGNKFSSAIGSAPQAAIEAVSPTQGGSLADEVATFEQTPEYSAQFPGQQPAMAAQQPTPVQQVAQALPAAGQAQQAAPAINEAIIRAITDPRATPQTRAIAQSLMEQQMRQQQALQQQAAEQQTWLQRQQYEQQQKISDPAYQVGLEKSRFEVENLKNPRLTAGDKLAREKFDYERQNKSPELETLYDEKTGQEYKARWNQEKGQFERVGGSKAPSGTSLSVGPDGSVQFTQGGAKLTESQSKDAFFTTRMSAATPTLNAYESALMSLADRAAGAVPFNLGNYAQSQEYQLARDAGRDFVTAYLRKDSGAALTPAEEKMYGEMLLPQPGDKAATIEAKRTRRAIATEAIKSGMPASALDNVLKAIKAVPGADQAQDLVPTDIPNVTIRRKSN